MIATRLVAALAAASIFAPAASSSTPFPVPSGARVEAAQDEVGRRALDHEDYDKWSSIGEERLSEDGAWLAFAIRPAEGASTLSIREVATQKLYTIRNGSRLRFTYDSQFAVYLIVPDPDLIKRLEKDDAPKSERPRSKLEILHLASGRHTTLPDVRSFLLPEEGTGWLAYLPTTEKRSSVDREAAAELSETYAIHEGRLAKAEPQPAAGPAAAPAEAGASSGEPKGDGKKAEPAKEDDELGDPLVLRELASGVEQRFPYVKSHRFSKLGTRLAFATSAADGKDDGVFVVDLATSKLSQVSSGRGNYSSLAFNEDGTRLAFLTDRDDYGPVKPSLGLHLWSVGEETAQKIVDAATEGVPKDWWIASERPTFTEDGRRLFFRTQPRPDDAGKTKKEIEKEKKAEARDPVVKLDVWHWKDDMLQPQQLLQAERERSRSYSAVYDLAGRSMVQLGTSEIPDVAWDPRSTADVVVGSSSLPYAASRSWDSPGFSDTYLIDLNTGEAQRVLEKVRGTGSLSPGGEFIHWWDPDQLSHRAMSVEGREIVDLTGAISTSFANELHDTPSPPRSYGSAGWAVGDLALLVYDRFDLWRVDPRGELPPECVTGGAGRESSTRFRYVRLDPEERAIDLEASLLLSAFDEGTKASGYSVLASVPGKPEPKLMLDESVNGLRKAPKGETVVLRRGSFRRFPDLWSTSLEFNELKRMTEANPQQRDYLWGTAELVHYASTDGQPLDGLLYKPDNFDPARKYPMMVYFYERNSDGLHRYHTPAPGGSSINYSFYVSRGYVVFVPDIPYETGQPGQSAADAVLPGIQSIVDRGFVDAERIGVQGHSWGGYQIAYLVTMTNVFACAEAGAPVSNMTSAYGGIRWASGMSRMFQYERTQSRIGDTLWNARDLYIENSPVFFADKVETPLLMLHNDEDGAVPWYQGIEMFVALRRLQKPVWMLNYNGEAHGLRKEENRLDFAKRMQQFFDHYLLDGPATRWIAEGVPAVDKGKDLGLSVVPSEE